MVDQAAANWNTSLGAACFLACALDTLRSGRASKMPLRRKIRELEHKLIAFQVMAGTAQCESRRAQFEAAIRRYAGFYLDHMHTEEAEILPLAEAVLGDAEWAELDAAFLENRDPLAGYEADEVYRPLFRKIVAALEKKSSVGSALEAFAGMSQPRFLPSQGVEEQPPGPVRGG